MKFLLFCLLLLLNLFAVLVSVLWLLEDRGYEPVVMIVTLCANIIGVLYTKPHWKSRKAQRTVIQTRNIAGGDIAAGNISKHGETRRGR